MKKLLLFVLFFKAITVFSQLIPIADRNDTLDLIFNSKTIDPYDKAYAHDGKLILSGYLDLYGAHYSDTSNANGMSKFPTIAPYNNQIGINILQFSAKYQSPRLKANATLFGGDCAVAAWSSYLNFIQEANIGVKLYRKLWLETGYFRTHIGIESIQPRENIALSLASITYYGPYFMSGAKLTWLQSDKFAIQLNAFNSFNGFKENNKNKALGFSINYNPNSKIRLSLSSLECNESTVETLRQVRLYNNFCFMYNSKKTIIGIEFNYGYQTHSTLPNLELPSYVISSIAQWKHRLNPQFATYTRAEFYYDPNEILSGPVENENHNLIGEDLIGLTHGYEFKPIPNSFVRLESRALKNLGNKIFDYYGTSSNYRLEILAGIGFWF